jgi:CDP-paratose 2-epimerase
MNSILITGGIGFIGCNAAQYFMKKGWRVVVLDNLSRAGTETNLDWLKKQGEFSFLKYDIRNSHEVDQAFKDFKFDFVLHLAGQVAVTTSVLNPREDFEINALGTLNLLESIRKYSPQSFVLYASTNKVYGKLDYLKVVNKDGRYQYLDRPSGVDENCHLDFHSPYGCSKGAADQYMIDYARIYNIQSCVFRQSCIYGTRQFGIEDQGWVAWFTIASILGKPISIFGDGMQVRDALFIEDLVFAYEAAFENRNKISGEAFNIGGGMLNTLSLLQLVSLLEEKLKKKIPVNFANWRPGDQKLFVCDISKFSMTTGWIPRTSTERGVSQLIDWVLENEGLLKSVLK